MRMRILCVGVVALGACGEQPMAPEQTDDDLDDPVVAAVSLASPIGAIIAVDYTVGLSASAVDDGGNELDVALAWSSDNPAVATVTNDGVVTGISVGVATIEASAEGVDGVLDIEVAAADLEAIRTLLDDPLAEELLSSIGGTTEASVRSAWAECRAGRSSGSLIAVRDCVLAARSALADESAPDRRPLTTLVGFFLEWIERHLNLSGPAPAFDHGA